MRRTYGAKIKKILCLTLTLAIIMGLMPTLSVAAADYEINIATVASAGTGYTYASNVITFTTASNVYSYKITGTTTAKRIVVAAGATPEIELSDVSIQNTVSPFQITAGANVTLTLIGSNTIRGTTTASSTDNTAGISLPSGADLTINGEGSLEVTGGYGGAGIGGTGGVNGTAGTTGSTGGSGSVTTVSQGIVVAKGSSYGVYFGIAGIAGNGGSGDTAGFGSGAAGTAGTAGSVGGAGTDGSQGTNEFTSGNISPVNSSGTVSINGTGTADLINGSTYGSLSVYMTTVTVVDIDDNTVSGADVIIKDNLNGPYTYTAKTDSDGIAYVWIPYRTGDVLFEAEDDTYGSESTETQLTQDNTNAVTIKLVPFRTSLSKTGMVFKTAGSSTTPGDLSIKAENLANGLKDIKTATWFRVSASDTTNYTAVTDFDNKDSTVSSSNKGNLTGSGTTSLKTYTLPIGENAIYWVKVEYLDSLGASYYQVKSLLVDNIFTQSNITSTGVEQGNLSNVLYTSILSGLTGVTGVAFDLQSTITILNSTADGITMSPGTTAAYTVIGQTLPIWDIAAPASQAVSIDGISLSVQFEYMLKSGAVTVSFATYGGTAVADQYYMSGSTYGTLPTTTKTNYAFQGWYDAAAGGTEVTRATMVPTGNHTLHAQWKNNTASMVLTPDVYTVQAGTEVTWTLVITNPFSSPDIITSVN